MKKPEEYLSKSGIKFNFAGKEVIFKSDVIEAIKQAQIDAVKNKDEIIDKIEFLEQQRMIGRFKVINKHEDNDLSTILNQILILLK